MRKARHGLLLWTWLVLIVCQTVHSQLSCERIPISFCCTSRIRDQCPEQCAAVQCGSEFIHSLFSTDVNPKPSSGAHDGSANVGNSRTGSAFVDERPPPPPPPSPMSGVDAPWNLQTSNPHPANSGDASLGTTPYSTSVFPTLIPFSSEPQLWSTISTTPAPPAPQREVHNIAQRHRHRTTPDPRIIRPPETLVVIGDYDEDEPSSENAVVDSPQPVIITTSPPSAVISNSGDVFSRSRKEITANAETLSNSSPDWKVSIIPRGQSKVPLVNSIPPLTVDGKSDERFNKFYNTIDKVINKLEFSSGGDLRFRETDPQIRLEGSTKDLSLGSGPSGLHRTTVAPGFTNKVSVVPFRPIQITAFPPSAVPGPTQFTTPPSPEPATAQCGIAPEFTPCVDNAIASKSLLECCQRKNLPPGCQQLCRYDITQAEIRAAMDRGQCGIFNVAPFLECASQGRDNSECCRHRGIVQKTGPQCEQFCRPAQGLSALGIQHIVCGNAVGDMLHCHHSGVRI
uniref:DB domain-containing protein n=1 Tax=Caenorhabditis japonica TaxID=281687 RepID=A0A8R1DM11_CAEJA